MKADGLIWAWWILGASVLTYTVTLLREQSFNAGYWKGRQAGWNSHRRMTNIKQMSDEVFDYDKQN